MGHPFFCGGMGWRKTEAGPSTPLKNASLRMTAKWRFVRSHPSRKNNSPARMGHPFFCGGMGWRKTEAGPSTPLKNASLRMTAEWGFVLSHPSRKNNGPARMGHPFFCGGMGWRKTEAGPSAPLKNASLRMTLRWWRTALRASRLAQDDRKAGAKGPREQGNKAAGQRGEGCGLFADLSRWTRIWGC